MELLTIIHHWNGTEKTSCVNTEAVINAKKRRKLFLGKYAEHTQTSISNTITEIDRLLDRYGADQFMYGSKSKEAQIMFVKHNRIVRFKVDMPDKNDERFLKTDTGRERKKDAAFREYEQEKRRRWRGLLLVIKGKLEAVDTGIETFECAFLAHFVLPDDKTIADHIIPKLDQACEGKAIKGLIPYFEEQ